MIFIIYKILDSVTFHVKKVTILKVNNKPKLIAKIRRFGNITK